MSRIYANVAPHAIGVDKFVLPKGIADIISPNFTLEGEPRMKKIIWMVAVVLVLSTAVFADIAKPSATTNGKPIIETTLDIRLDANAKDARLIIPRSQIKQLRAELESMDDGSDNTAAVISGPGISRLQTIMSGLFLSLAFVIGGVWFVRSGRAGTRAAKGAVGVIVLSFVATAATFVFANAGPPPEARSITGKMFTSAVHMYGFGWGKIKVEVSDEARDRIQLIVPSPPKTTATPGEEE